LAPTVGIAAIGFCYPDGILQLFHRQDQQILRLRTAAAAFIINNHDEGFTFRNIILSWKI
jgi:hypothetical protein